MTLKLIMKIFFLAATDDIVQSKQAVAFLSGHQSKRALPRGTMSKSRSNKWIAHIVFCPIVTIHCLWICCINIVYFCFFKMVCEDGRKKIRSPCARSCFDIVKNKCWRRLGEEGFFVIYTWAYNICSELSSLSLKRGTNDTLVWYCYKMFYLDPGASMVVGLTSLYKHQWAFPLTTKAASGMFRHDEGYI